MINQRNRASLLFVSCLFVLGGCVSGPYRTGSRSGYPDAPSRDDRAIGERRERGAGGELGRLAHELDTRASRAHQVAERSSSEPGRGEQVFYGRIHRFSDRARQFHGQLENGELGGRRLRDALEHLLDDARETDRSLRRTRVSREMLEEWQGITRLLDRMITLAG